MTDPLHALFQPGRWPVFALVSARVSGLMLMAPLWSMPGLPKTVRAAVVVLLTLLLMPLVPDARVPEAALALPLPLAGELMIGLLIGLTAAVIVYGVTLGGEVISLQMGLSLGHALAPTPEVEVSSVGQLQSVLALLIYASVGGHLMLIRGLADSLAVLPPGVLPSFEGAGRSAAMLFGTLFSTAVRAAAPVMVALLLANVAIAILGRAVPQLNAMMVSFPITIGLGLLVLGLALPAIGGAVVGWVQGLPRDVTSVLQTLPVRP